MLQDTWALKAQREGYRSRAVYKLEEILVKVKYNNQSCKVLDIGCAPGGWSDYFIKKYPKSSLYGIASFTSNLYPHQSEKVDPPTPCSAILSATLYPSKM